MKKIKNKKMAEEIKQPEELKFDLMTAIEYITEKRNDILEHLNDRIKANDYKHDVEMHDALATVLRVNVQLRTLEECLIAFRIMNAQTEENKKRIN
jgi:hypothetical protein